MMKLSEIIHNVFFISGVFVIKLAERSFCFRILSLRFAGIFFWLIDLFLHALLGKKKPTSSVCDGYPDIMHSGILQGRMCT